MHRARALLFTLYISLKLASAENTSIRLVSLTIKRFPFLGFTSFTNIFYFVILVRENKLSCYFLRAIGTPVKWFILLMRAVHCKYCGPWFVPEGPGLRC